MTLIGAGLPGLERPVEKSGGEPLGRRFLGPHRGPGDTQEVPDHSRARYRGQSGHEEREARPAHVDQPPRDEAAE